MKWKGIELKKVTEPQICNPPKKMFVWGYGYQRPSKDLVVAIVKRADGICAMTFDGDCYPNCADIPEEPKPRRATNKELAKWMAQGNGQVHYVGAANCHTFYSYQEGEDDTTVYAAIRIRKWDDTDWHEPTADYMCLEDE